MTQDNAAGAAFWNSPATRSWADQHARIDRVMAGLTAFALGIADPRPGEKIVDIGCGSGTTVLALAERVGPGGHVLGVDIAAASVARAQARIADAGVSHAEVMLADAATHPFPPASLDLVFSRFGVMFFADPIAAFANLHGALKGTGRLTAAVFRSPAENPFATAPMAAIRHLVPPVAPPAPGDPGQFAWADPARVHRILEGAGFKDVTLTPHDPPMRVAEPGDAAGAAEYAMSLGPAMRATLDMAATGRERVRAALETFFRDHDGPSGITLQGAIWVVTARA